MSTDAKDTAKTTGGAAPKPLTAAEKIARAHSKPAAKLSTLERMNKAELRAYASDHGIKLEGGNAQAWRACIAKSGKAPK